MNYANLGVLGDMASTASIDILPIIPAEYASSDIELAFTKGQLMYNLSECGNRTRSRRAGTLCRGASSWHERK